MRRGSVVQRHTRACPRDGQGGYAPHKCRGPWAYFLVVGRRSDGSRHQVSRSGYPTKRSAASALAELLQRENAEIAAVHGLMTGEYLRQWLSGKRALRATTLRSYESHLRLYLQPALGSVLLADLRPHHLDAMYVDLMAGGDRERSAATIRRIHATLRSALNTAAKRRLIPWNPALHVELPSALHTSTTVWTGRQVGQFLDAHEGHRTYALWHLIALVGLRRGEALGLHWSDVDLATGMLCVRQQLVETKDGLRLGPPKTASGERAVPLDIVMVEVLREHQERQTSDRRNWGGGWVESGLVFARENGDHLRPDHVTHLFARLTAEAGLPRIRLHDLRHTSASLALAAGVPMKVVSERLGHSSTAITADLYTHVVPSVAREAADRIAATVPLRRLHGNQHAYSAGTAQSTSARSDRGDT